MPREAPAAADEEDGMATHARFESPHPAAPLRPPPAVERRSGELSWAAVGVMTGILGALVIALFFLVLDGSEGRPLWTPTALGSALFLREELAAGAAPDLPLVLGYTAAHGAVFLSIGLMAAFALVGRRRLRPLRGVALAALFFVVFEVLILGFVHFAAPGLVGGVGDLKISVANLLASGSMAAFLGWMAPRVGG
jgi:hypothetical protein